MKNKLLNETFKLGVMSAIVTMAMPGLAMASGDTLATVMDSIRSTQLSSIPQIMGAVCYIGGAFLLVSGTLSLKKHAENPSSEPMAKGIARLLTGGAITSVPALTNVIQSSTKLGTGQASYKAFSVSF